MASKWPGVEGFDGPMVLNPSGVVPTRNVRMHAVLSPRRTTCQIRSAPPSPSLDTLADVAQKFLGSTTRTSTSPVAATVTLAFPPGLHAAKGSATATTIDSMPVRDAEAATLPLPLAFVMPYVSSERSAGLRTKVRFDDGGPIGSEVQDRG
ncbi:hypothetical protein LTR94_032656, partial [Friedmanniomyces endolithicus]